MSHHNWIATPSPKALARPARPIEIPPGWELRAVFTVDAEQFGAETPRAGHWDCPLCGAFLLQHQQFSPKRLCIGQPPVCPDCGQALDWWHEEATP